MNNVSLPRFRRQLALAWEWGYTFVPAAEIAAGIAPKNALAVTFDDGLQSAATHAAPILADLGIPWTTFVVAGWADGRHPWGAGIVSGWREVEALAKTGAVIGNHSLTHPNFGRLDPARIPDEVAAAKDLIERRLGIVTTEFAIPFGQSRDWTAAAQAAALESGHCNVYAQSGERRWPGTVARTFITKYDNDRIFRAALEGRFDRWEEWF